MRRRQAGGKPINIAVIGLRGFPGVIGGIERHCELLYPALAEQEPDLHITIFMRGAIASQNDYGPHLQAIDVWAPRTFGVETVVHSFFSMFVARFRCQADVVHLHGIGPGLFAALARVLGMKVVVTHHAPDYERPKWGAFGRWLLRQGEALTARYADRIICVSDALHRSFTTLYPQASARTITIRHAIPRATVLSPDPLPDFDLPPQGYVLAAGRFDRTKRFEDIIEAHLMSQTDLALVIAGKSAGEPAYDAELTSRRDSRVVFSGYRPPAELRHLVQNCTAFVHASQMEGAGLVVLEALAEQVPVLLSDIPPHREFGLSDSSYFQIGNITELAEKLAGPFVPERASTYERIRAEYRLDAMVAAHAQVYRDVCSASPDSRIAPQ